MVAFDKGQEPLSFFSLSRTACISHSVCIRHAEASEILQGWNLRFDKELVNFDARVLPSEKIHQANKQVSPTTSVNEGLTAGVSY